jgi:hypothetical protein
MSLQNKYEGYSWIPTSKYKPIEIDGVKFIPEDHHVGETMFLINEIRKLAKLIDELEENQYFEDINNSVRSQIEDEN